MRRACGSSWWRRWRGIVWCCVCLVCLALLGIWDTLVYLLAASGYQRTRHCPPSPIEVDGCASWRPLQLPHPVCRCKRELLVLHDTCADFAANDAASYMTYTKEYYGASHCSGEATLRGPRQHVVSLALEHLTPKDIAAINRTIHQINSVYKGWLIRVYTPSKNHSNPDLCSLVCDTPNLDLCHIKGKARKPPSDGSRGRTGWRWHVLGDPLVSVWLVRYQEMAVLEREAHAVTQFINSDKCWHLMKDHMLHAKSPLGSTLLGGKTSWGTKTLSKVRRRLISEVHTVGDEETILEEALLLRMDHDVMTHNSVSCQTTIESVPFPSKRHPGQWVGMPSENLDADMTLQQSKNIGETKPDIKPNKSIVIQKLSAKSNSVLLPKQIPGKPEVISKNDHTDDKSGKSNADHETQIESLSTATKPSKGEPKVPQKSKDVPPLDPVQEREINLKNDIVECPKACRPHLHPDWLYC